MSGPSQRLVLRDVQKSYGVVSAVRGVDLTINGKEFVSLLGPSGSGKTTLLRCVAGLEEIDKGSIALGERVLNSSERKIFLPPERRHFGMVFQSYALWPHMTVGQNVSYPLRVARHGRQDTKEAVLRVLELVGIAHLVNRSVAKLSGGQQQRVALARAIVAKPEVTLFDEPLSNLDAALRDSVREYILTAHRAAGGISLYVTHDQGEALYLSDRVAVIMDGIIHQFDTPAAVAGVPANLAVARFLGFDNILPGTVIDGHSGSCSVQLSDMECVVSGIAQTPLRPGTKVVVAIRSKHLFATAVGDYSKQSSGTNAWIGRVRTARNVEGMRTYDVEVDRATLKVCSWERPAAAGTPEVGIPSGADVVLRVDRSQALVYPAAESEGG